MKAPHCHQHYICHNALVPERLHVMVASRKQYAAKPDNKCNRMVRSIPVPIDAHERMNMANNINMCDP